MTPHIPEEFSTRLIDWSPFMIMGNTMPPRDSELARHPSHDFRRHPFNLRHVIVAN
jgi:hypothetical protein